MNKKYFSQVVGSDIYPYEVVEVVSDKKVIVREMSFKWKVYEGDCYDYKSTNKPTKTITLRKNNHWYQVGDSMNGCRFYPKDEPIAYRSPSV